MVLASNDDLGLDPFFHEDIAKQWFPVSTTPSEFNTLCSSIKKNILLTLCSYMKYATYKQR